MLVITEISEAVEAERKGKHAQRKMFERENITPQPHPDKHFMYVFDMFVKDSVEDELADTVIRLLDLAGLCSVDLRHVCGLCDTIKDYMNYDFMPLCFMWCWFATNRSMDVATLITHLIADIFVYCKQNNIDLLWHIEQKMRYNELRPRLNGKNF